MILLRFNLMGFLQFMFAGYMAVILLCIGKIYAALFAPLAALVVIDLLTRLFFAYEYNYPLFHPDAGGSFHYAPVWCMAFCAIILSGFYVFFQ